MSAHSETPTSDQAGANASHDPPHRDYDIIVIGAGIAGLAFTLRLPPSLRVALLTKANLGESNTRYAQGGLAAAVGPDDSSELHVRDTLDAGAGLCDEPAVRAMVDGARAAVDWLLDIGTVFDRDGEVLLLGREAAHSRRRVLHAGGDATGAEIERALVAQVHADEAVDVFEGAFARDLVIADGRCAGLIAELSPDQEPEMLTAPLVVIAAGGAGQLWATTSNPLGATADGLAMALRAGVAVADLEFMQFHPTVLTRPGMSPFLVSEAVRGEGAYLRGADGERFMVDLHPLAELAPRDIVARAIQRQMAVDNAEYVYLDLRHLPAGDTRVRFPTIGAELATRGFDLTSDLIPIAPAAHYYMGGIVAGTQGETSLPGLLAIGEVTSTGVHGANRLASNSLLEGLVFGLAAAAEITARGVPERPDSAKVSAAAERIVGPPIDSRELARVDIGALRRDLQLTMSRHVAVVREGGGLHGAIAEIAAINHVIDRVLHRPSSAHWSGAPNRAHEREARELANMATVAAAIASAALRREESRGGHYRLDFPEVDPAWDQRHLLLLDGPNGAWQHGELRQALVTGDPIAVR